MVVGGALDAGVDAGGLVGVVVLGTAAGAVLGCAVGLVVARGVVGLIGCAVAAAEKPKRTSVSGTQ
jgi:hypothetical protein